MKHFKSRFNKRKEASAFFDLTPMIDIVFILLVFFILTANVAQNVFDLTLPTADENYKEERGASEIKQVKITLFSSGKYAIGEKTINEYDDFKNEIIKIHNADRETEFLIISEANLSVEKFMSLLTFLKSKKITKIDILLKKQ